MTENSTKGLLGGERRKAQINIALRPSSLAPRPALHNRRESLSDRCQARSSARAARTLCTMHRLCAAHAKGCHLRCKNNPQAHKGTVNMQSSTHMKRSTKMRSCCSHLLNAAGATLPSVHCCRNLWCKAGCHSAPCLLKISPVLMALQLMYSTCPDVMVGCYMNACFRGRTVHAPVCDAMQMQEWLAHVRNVTHATGSTLKMLATIAIEVVQ